MPNTFPTPADIVTGLQVMYADRYESGPSESLFSVLLHRNGQLAGVACLPASVDDERLRDCAQEAKHHKTAATVVLVAVSDGPIPVLQRAASHYSPRPAMLIGVESLRSGYWSEYNSGTSGQADRDALRTGRRFLGHWDFCTFSETFAPKRYSHARPTKFKAIEKPLAQFAKNVANGRVGYDQSRTGGVLVHSEDSRDEAIRSIDVNPRHAMNLFIAAAREFSDQARLEALVAAGIAAYFAKERAISEHALIIATAESDSGPVRFDDRMRLALDALLTGKVIAATATDLVTMYPPVKPVGGTSRQTA